MRKVFFVFAMLFILTVPCSALPVSSEFGWRIHPISGDWKFHAGVDLAYDYGTPVNCLFDGIVVMAGNYGDGYGNQVLMYHPSIDAYTRYAHLQAVYVEVGQSIPGNTLIGEVGSTGNSTGPHLHLEYVIPDGNGGYVYTNPLILWQ